MKITKMTNIEGFTTALETIKGSEAAIKANLNEWGVIAIAGVFAGDNVKQVNDLLAVFGTVRAKRLSTIIGKMLPFKKCKETGKFLNKDKNEKLAEKKAIAFAEFCASDDTLYDLMENAKAQAKADKTPEEQQKAALQALNRALEQCVTTGVAYDAVQSASLVAGYTLADVMNHLRQAA